MRPSSSLRWLLFGVWVVCLPLICRAKSVSGGGDAPAADPYDVTAEPYFEYAPTIEHVHYEAPKAPASYSENVGNAFGALIVGIIMFIASHLLLFQNEGRSVKRDATLREALARVRPVSPDIAIDTTLERQLVHVSGQLTTCDRLEDSEFLTGEAAVNALSLQRQVEMWQWIEHKETRAETLPDGGRVHRDTYSYTKSWSSIAFDSSKYQNPPYPSNPSMPINSTAVRAHNIMLGNYRLSGKQIQNLKPANEPLVIQQSSYELYASSRPNTHRLSDNQLYIGTNPNQPEIGDIKVTFLASYPHVVSIIAQQSGNSFVECAMRHGTIDLLTPGSLSAPQMLADQTSNNSALKWLLRILSFLFMWLGMVLMGQPLVALVDIIPVIGTILSFGVASMSFLTSIPLSLITVAIARVYYQPGLAFMILAAAIIIFAIIGGYVPK